MQERGTPSSSSALGHLLLLCSQLGRVKAVDNFSGEATVWETMQTQRLLLLVKSENVCRMLKLMEGYITWWLEQPSDDRVHTDEGMPNISTQDLNSAAQLTERHLKVMSVSLLSGKRSVLPHGWGLRSVAFCFCRGGKERLFLIKVKIKLLLSDVSLCFH